MSIERSCSNCRFSDVLKNSGHYWDAWRGGRKAMRADSRICRWGPPSILSNLSLGSVDHPRVSDDEWCYRFERKIPEQSDEEIREELSALGTDEEE